MLTGSLRPAIVGLALAVALASLPDVRAAHSQSAPASRVASSSPLAATIASSGLSASEQELVRHFYDARGEALVWTSGTGLTRDGLFVLGVLRASGDDGIDPARYNVERLAAPIQDDAAARALRDVRFTASLLRYASDMLNGRPELRAIDRDVDLPRDPEDLAIGLANALGNRQLYEFFKGLAPTTVEYNDLRIALARYRMRDAQGGWGILPQTKPFRAADIDAAALAALNLRLSFEDAAVDPSKPPSVEQVDAAIRRFQRRNGLDADGVVGTKTLQSLNKPASERALAVAANMERLRWLPHRLEPVRVVVNVPDARLAILDGDKELLSSAVIVGKPSTPTPIFRAEITQVIANPPWNVPTTIARDEILPRVARDPDYLAKHNMIMVDGQVRQLPGASNALGELKIDLDNRFSVYLHDTPSRGLFNRPQRFLSHGCVRVAQIFPLASYAINGDTASGIAQLIGMVATTMTVRLPARARVPVYVTYATVYPSAEGLQFRADIYGRDRRLIAAMTADRQFARAGRVPDCTIRG